MRVVTWDPDFFAANNLTSDKFEIKLQVFKLNSTTGARGPPVDLTDKAIRANEGYWPWRVDGGLLDGQEGMNLTLHAMYAQVVGGALKELTGPTLLITKAPIYRPAPVNPPTGLALYIGIPIIFAFILVTVVGSCIWNRHRRQIGLGNVMSRGRNGYATGKSRAQRMATKVRHSIMRKGGNDRGIRLTERDVPAHQQYRDAPPPVERGVEGMPRRDSDALGSLAGSPVDNWFQPQGVTGGNGGNAFRDEMARQDRERF